jgi:hypothetical protein
VPGRRFYASEVPGIDVYMAREKAKRGDRAGAIRVLRKAIDDLFHSGQLAYCVQAIGALVEALLDRGAPGDLQEAEYAVNRLAAAPVDDGLAMRDIMLRVRALLARAHGDADRYRAFADQLSKDGGRTRFRGTHQNGRGDDMTAS